MIRVALRYKSQLIVNARYFSYYVTTPIFYVNSSPHIGHVHTILVADALNIFHRLRFNTNNTLFSGGTDEHGIKIQTAAEAKKIEYQKFCDINSKKFSDLFEQYNTTLTDFIRTTQPRHRDAVSCIWRKLKAKGFIYKSTYSGWYCNSDETFVPEGQVTKKELDTGDVIFLDQNENPLVWSSEENYMFRLSDFKVQLYNWLKNEKPISPEIFNDEAIKLVQRHDFGDISISRPTKRLKWAIKVPDDSSQSIYVWLDALTNYLTVVGYPCATNDLKRWPVDCHVLGKDIIKFHAIYWPAFLLALSLPLPKKLISHSHWLLDSFKMSKSRGNVVDPQEESRIMTIEGLRYYLLRAATPHSDTDFSRTQAVRRVNAEIADTYGNLLSRCCATAINPNQSIPTKLSFEPGEAILELRCRLSELKDLCESHYTEANFYKGVDVIISVLRHNNALYESMKPWKLVKEIDRDSQILETYLNLQAMTFETLRVCSILLQPIIPKLASSALDRLSVEKRTWNDAVVGLDHGNPNLEQRKVNQNVESVLFQRLKTSQ